MKLINTILESILTSDLKNTIIIATSDVILSIHPQPTLLIPAAKQILVQRGEFLKKLWCCVGGRVSASYVVNM